MKLLVSGKEVPLKSVVIYDDLSQYFTTVEVVVEAYIPVQEVILQSKQKVRCVVLRSVYENDVYRYTLTGANTWKLLNSSCSAFTGLATVQKLLASIGIKQSLDIKTNESFWSIPTLKFKNVIQYLNRFAAVSSGGAPRFYVDLDGNISCVDFKKSLSNKATRCVGEVVSDVYAMDWIIDTPGVVDATVFSKDGIRQKTIKFKEYGRGNIRVNDTTGYEFDRMQQRLSNEFYFNLYTSRKVTVTNLRTQSYNLGDTVTINELKEPFVIFSRTIFVPISDGMPEITLTLSRACLE